MFTLLGFRRMTGTSKNGNNYDFVLLYCSSPARLGTVGSECLVLNADYDDFTEAAISVGDAFNACTSERNGRFSVTRFI